VSGILVESGEASTLSQENLSGPFAVSVAESRCRWRACRATPDFDHGSHGPTRIRFPGSAGVPPQRTKRVSSEAQPQAFLTTDEHGWTQMSPRRNLCSSVFIRG